MKLQDTIEYTIASHYLSALINDDYSGLNNEETVELNEFIRREYPAGAKATSWTIGDDESESFARCSVSGFMANCSTVVLIIYA
jgi:hypothetical protein